jgi:hypothetical protein
MSNVTKIGLSITRAGAFATEFSRLVFLESRIASPVASIGGELERGSGRGPSLYAI